eukprot:5755104-Amphidinium_carterae.2
MELKVAYKQKHKTVIENKLEYKQNHYHDYSIITTPKNLNDDYAVKMTIEIYLKAAAKRERDRDYLLLHPPHENRFFVFIVQHYERRLFNIFQRAGATVDEYNQVLAYFDRKCAIHFTKPNRRDLQAIRSAPTTSEDRERELQQNVHKAQSIPEDEIDEKYEVKSDNDNFDERSTTRPTRASGSTSTKRKISEDTTDKKKMHTGTGNTVINIYNATIHKQTLSASSLSTSPRPTTPTKEGNIITVPPSPRTG